MEANKTFQELRDIEFLFKVFTFLNFPKVNPDALSNNLTSRQHLFFVFW